MRGVFLELLEREFHPHYQNPIITKAGAERMIAWHNTVLRDEGGRPTGTLSIGEDVTEHLRLEEQYRQAQKMEAVGRLAGGIAHDFNNLLTAILGFSELTMARLAKDDPTRGELQEVLKAGHRAAALTRQMLAFSRRQVMQPRLIDLNERVTDLLKMLKRLIGEDVELVPRLAPGLGLVMADPGQIEQVVMNLAVNSRDAMPEGGQLILETRDVEPGDELFKGYAASAPGRFVMLAVIDTGTAMSDEVKTHLFEPFFTTKEVGKGTGLGLATVYGIVKQSGGHITVESEKGKGTAFRIYLPRADGERESRTGIAVPRMRTGTETILLVEDEEAVRKLAAAVLGKSGYGVFEAANGAEGLEVIARHPGKIDLAITDVVMPVMSGHEFSRRLAEASPATRVIFMSGYSDTAVHQLAVSTEIPFLQKPFTSAQLLQKTQEVLESKRPGSS
jgi:signal transduction histidine kinase/ActR/RegA family two-component response regulator